MRQAWMTVHDYFINLEDMLVKKGYTKEQRAQMLPGLVQAAAQDFHTCYMQQEMARFRELLDEQTGTVHRIGDALEEIGLQLGRSKGDED